ncbi:MAG: VIT domain-containing protein [Phycisphaerae bacterium]
MHARSRPLAVRPAAAVLAAVLVAATAAHAVETQPVDPLATLHKEVTEGSLRVQKEDGSVVACPLKHTDVEAEISGFIARVTVTQVFHNPLDETIEAVYVFPLPHKAAVDDMTMVVGEKRIVGVIKRRAAAREIYEDAVRRGATAALLEQERPNIFTQSVGNIDPGQEVRIEISYVDVLEYDMGVYAFHFPMVVGPRYIPGKPTSKTPKVPEELKGKVGTLEESKGGGEGGSADPSSRNPKSETRNPSGTGWSPDTDRAGDASRITPPVLKPGMRSGHDIRLSVWLDAGVPIQDLKSPNHKVRMDRQGPTRATVDIAKADAIPNKDFRLEYAVVGEKPEMAVLTHTDPAGNGYFMLMVQPREDERLAGSPPRELSFLIDVSGSMRGDKTAKVREAMGHLLKLAGPADTLQVITFAGNSAKVFEKPVPCTEANVAQALKVTEGLRGSGGTEMLKGVKMAINDPLDPKRVRIVIMLTDGFIGNEAEIIEEVGRRCGDHVRFWCIGIGQSPNRMLTDGVARQGGGMAKVLGLNDDALPMTQEIMYRIHRAQLAGVRIDWGDLKVWETYPARIPELWAGRPIILFGRYEPGSGRDTITVRGKVEGEPAAWPLAVHLPVREVRHDVLAKVWARRKIEELMHTTFYAGSPEVKEAVTQVALEYRLMSQYTSFVAVDESDLDRMAEPARPPRRMLVPVPIPEGAVYEGFFGGEVAAPAEMSLAAADAAVTGSLFGGGGAVREAETRRRGRTLSFTGPAPAAMPPRHDPASTLRRNWHMGRKQAAANRPAGFVGYGLGSGGGGNALFEMVAKAPAPRGVSAGSGAVHYDYFATEGLDGISLGVPGYLRAAMDREEVKAMAEQAAKALEAANELKEKGDLLAARARAAHAVLLDVSLAGGGGGNVSQEALAAIGEINEQLLQTWKKDHKALGRRLDLVLRDVSLAEACKAVTEAVGAKRLPIHIAAGSAEDAADVIRRAEVRITYLDLRGATVAQALDWLTQPERLTWRLAGGTVQVTSARRSPVAAPWVYDVSAVAMPSTKQVGEIKDHKKRLERVREDAERFLKAVREHLRAPDHAVVWYAPTQVLVFGDAKRHAKAAKFLADLADPKASLEGGLADLHRITSARAKARKDVLAKLGAAREKGRVLAAIETYTWRLLADAAAGRVDDEALTHLRVAWQDEAVADLATHEAAALTLLRSAWALTEASDLTKDDAVRTLAHAARRRSASARKQVIDVLEKSPHDLQAAEGLLYAALTTRNDVLDVRDDAERVLVGTDGGELPSPAAALRILAAALLKPAEEADAEALGELIMTGSRGVRGPDLVVLTALACRRTGGEAWRTFRAEARPLLGDQPLPGGVAVLVGRLARPDVRVTSVR